MVRFLDMAALVLAFPIFLLAGFPLAGYAAGGGAWIVQRAVQLKLQQRAGASKDPRTVVGITAASMIGRGWFTAFAVFGVGLAQNAAGLAAALLVVVLFTIYFSVKMILRPIRGSESDGAAIR